MMAEAIFVSDDGKQFKSEGEAIAHDKFCASRDAYNSAKMAWIRAIARKHQTADGHPFEFTFAAYYLPVEDDWPVLEEVSIKLRDCEVDECDRIQIRVRIHSLSTGNERYISYNINELYRDRRAAQAKLFQYQADAINRLVKATNETAKAIGHTPIVSPTPDPLILDIDQSPPPSHPLPPER